MGLLHKKERKEELKVPELPELPELPKLPELTEGEEDSQETIHQLPSFPNNSLGNKFSQDTIKNAIAGGEESDSEEIVDDFEEINTPQMIQEPLKKIDLGQKLKPLTMQSNKIVHEEEPLFVRLDKFEESNNILNGLKKQIEEVTHILNETNSIKEKEDEQLKKWEAELQNIKNKIEKVDKDLFSRL